MYRNARDAIASRVLKLVLLRELSLSLSLGNGKHFCKIASTIYAHTLRPWRSEANDDDRMITMIGKYLDKYLNRLNGRARDMLILNEGTR